MSKTPKRPPWLPPFNSWVRAISIIPFIPAGAITVFFPLVIWAIFSNRANSTLFVFLMSIASFSVFLIVAAIYAVCHHKFVKKATNWLPTSTSQWKGLYASFTLTMSMIPAVLLTLSLVRRRYGYSPYYLARRATEVPGHVTFISLAAFVVTASFLFYLESSVKEKFKK